MYRHAKVKGLPGAVMPELHDLWGGVRGVDGRDRWLRLLTDMGETVVTAQLSKQQRYMLFFSHDVRTALISCPDEP